MSTFVPALHVAPCRRHHGRWPRLAAAGLLAAACTHETSGPNMPPFVMEHSTSSSTDDGDGSSDSDGDSGQGDHDDTRGSAPPEATDEPPETTIGEPPSEGDPLDCGGVALPEEDLLLALDAGEGVEHEDGVVTRWTNLAEPGASFTPQGNSPQWVEGAAGGRPVVRFDGQGQRLFANIAIDGLEELTIAVVSATTTEWYPDDEWCQTDFGLERYEQGCSGTYNTPIMWNEAGDWGFTFLGPGQEWISYRFGTGVKAYSDLDSDPEVAALGYDPRVVWRRPEPIGPALTRTTAVKYPNDFSLYVEGEQVYANSLPEGTGPLTNVSDAVHLGGGRGDRYWAGDIAAIVVYARALDDEQLVTLDHVFQCRFFEDNEVSRSHASRHLTQRG